MHPPPTPFGVSRDSPKDSDTIRKNEVYLLSESKLRVKDAGETDPIGLKYSISTKYIDERSYKTLSAKCTSLRVMLIASCKTAKENVK